MMLKLIKEKKKISAQKVISAGVEEGQCDVAVFDVISNDKASKVDSWCNEIKEFKNVKSSAKRTKVIWSKKSLAKKTKVPHAFNSKISFSSVTKSHVKHGRLKQTVVKFHPMEKAKGELLFKASSCKF